MSNVAVLFVAMSIVAAFSDWLSVAAGDQRSEEAAKPAVLVALIGVAILLDPSSGIQRGLFVVALILSLVGDVALLPRFDKFVVGLAAFLLAHIGYVIGLLVTAESWLFAGIGVVIAGLGLATVGRRVIDGAPEALAKPVGAYMVALAAMVVAAFATENVYFMGGAVLFFVSDSILGWNRFVKPAPIKDSLAATRVAVHSTYHLAQFLLVMGLVG